MHAIYETCLKYELQINTTQRQKDLKHLREKMNDQETYAKAACGEDGVLGQGWQVGGMGGNVWKEMGGNHTGVYKRLKDNVILKN